MMLEEYTLLSALPANEYYPNARVPLVHVSIKPPRCGYSFSSTLPNVCASGTTHWAKFNTPRRGFRSNSLEKPRRGALILAQCVVPEAQTLGRVKEEP